MKRVALLVSLALAAAPALAAAQVGFGAAAGASLPMGDFGKGANTGYHAQVSLDVGVPLSPSASASTEPSTTSTLLATRRRLPPRPALPVQQPTS